MSLLAEMYAQALAGNVTSISMDNSHIPNGVPIVFQEHGRAFDLAIARPDQRGEFWVQYSGRKIYRVVSGKLAIIEQANYTNLADFFANTTMGSELYNADFNGIPNNTPIAVFFDDGRVDAGIYTNGYVDLGREPIKVPNKAIISYRDLFPPGPSAILPYKSDAVLGEVMDPRTQIANPGELVHFLSRLIHQPGGFNLTISNSFNTNNYRGGDQIDNSDRRVDYHPSWDNHSTRTSGSHNNLSNNRGMITWDDT